MQLYYQNVTAILHHQFQSLNLLLIYFFSIITVLLLTHHLSLSLYQPMQSRATKQLSFNKWVIQLKNKLYLLREERKQNRQMDLLGKIVYWYLDWKSLKFDFLL